MPLSKPSVPPTKQIFLSAGTVTGYWFSTSGIAVSPTAGATYTNNSVTYTFIGSPNNFSLFFSSSGGAHTFSGTTLTKTAGTGDATITFVGTDTQTAHSPVPLYTYTTPTNAQLLKVSLVAGGGAGGGSATAASAAGAGGGGGGSGMVIKWIPSPGASYYYSIGPGGVAGAAGNNPGLMGGGTFFGNNNSWYLVFGGNGGFGSATGTVPALTATGVPSSGTGDITLSGGYGQSGVTYSATVCQGGGGGSSWFAGLNCNQSTSSVIGSDANPNSGNGGAGGQSINNGGAVRGGTGGSGLVLVEEY